MSRASTQHEGGVVAGSTPAAALVGVLVLMGVLCLRVLTSYDPFPAWGGDPLEMASPIVGLTPLSSMVLDIATLIGAGLVFIGLPQRGLRCWQLVCLAAG